MGLGGRETNIFFKVILMQTKSSDIVGVYSTKVKVSTAKHFCFYYDVQNLKPQAQNYQVRMQQILFSLATKSQGSMHLCQTQERIFL